MLKTGVPPPQNVQNVRPPWAGDNSGRTSQELQNLEKILDALEVDKARTNEVKELGINSENEEEDIIAPPLKSLLEDKLKLTRRIKSDDATEDVVPEDEEAKAPPLKTLLEAKANLTKRLSSDDANTKEDWVVLKDDDGYNYYWNRKDDRTSYQCPEGVTPAAYDEYEVYIGGDEGSENDYGKDFGNGVKEEMVEEEDEEYASIYDDFWVKVKDPDNNDYYWNKTNNTTTYELPANYKRPAPPPLYEKRRMSAATKPKKKKVDKNKKNAKPVEKKDKRSPSMLLFMKEMERELTTTKPSLKLKQVINTVISPILCKKKMERELTTTKPNSKLKHVLKTGVPPPQNVRPIDLQRKKSTLTKSKRGQSSRSKSPRAGHSPRAAGYTPHPPSAPPPKKEPAIVKEQTWEEYIASEEYKKKKTSKVSYAGTYM